MVRFTDTVIEKGLRTVPDTFYFTWTRRSSCGPIRTRAGISQTCVGLPAVIDLESGQKRDCTLQDVADVTRLAYIEVSPISPLYYNYEAAEALFEIVEAGIPLGIIACPISGATGPM